MRCASGHRVTALRRAISDDVIPTSRYPENTETKQKQPIIINRRFGAKILTKTKQTKKMRKIYSLVLMTAMLFVGANAWAQTTLTLGTAESGATYQDLQSAINAANAGATTEIDLISDLTTTSTVWLGTANVGDDSKHIILDLNGHTYNYDGTAKIGFGLTHGTLEIKSTGTNEGIITTAKATEELICVYGTYEKINAKTGTPFAHLIAVQHR